MLRIFYNRRSKIIYRIIVLILIYVCLSSEFAYSKLDEKVPYTDKIKRNFLSAKLQVSEIFFQRSYQEFYKNIILPEEDVFMPSSAEALDEKSYVPYLIVVEPLYPNGEDEKLLEEFLENDLQTKKRLKYLADSFFNGSYGVTGAYKVVSFADNNKRIEGVVFYDIFSSTCGYYIGIIGLESHPDNRGEHKQISGVPELLIKQLVLKSKELRFRGRVFMRCVLLTEEGRGFAKRIGMRYSNGWGFDKEWLADEFLEQNRQQQIGHRLPVLENFNLRFAKSGNFTPSVLAGVMSVKRNVVSPGLTT